MTITCLLLSMMLAVDHRPKVTRSPIESRARDFVAYFTSAKYDMASKDFSETMRETVTPPVLAEMKRQSDYYLGPFRSIITVRQRTEEGFRIVEIVSKFDKSLGAFRVEFDVADRIGALYIDPIANEPVDPLLEATARAWLKNFIAGDFEAASTQFTTKLQTQLSPSQLAKLQAKVTNSYGAFRSVKEVRQITDEPFRTIDLTAEYEQAVVSIRVAFNKDGRVTGIKLEPLTPDQ
jgi:uncharacterized protein DUF3887